MVKSLDPLRFRIQPPLALVLVLVEHHIHHLTLLVHMDGPDHFRATTYAMLSYYLLLSADTPFDSNIWGMRWDLSSFYMAHAPYKEALHICQKYRGRHLGPMANFPARMANFTAFIHTIHRNLISVPTRTIEP